MQPVRGCWIGGSPVDPLCRADHAGHRAFHGTRVDQTLLQNAPTRTRALFDFRFWRFRAARGDQVLLRANPIPTSAPEAFRGSFDFGVLAGR